MSNNKKKQHVKLTKEEFIQKQQQLEQRQREFLMSDDYADATTRMYTAYYLLSVAREYIDDVYDILSNYGSANMNSIRKEILSMLSAFDRYDKKFRTKMLPKNSPQYAGRCNCIINGFEDLRSFTDNMINKTLYEGKKYMQYVRIRAQLGHGCDTCRKFLTNHCSTSRIFPYPTETACLAYQQKLTENNNKS